MILPGQHHSNGYKYLMCDLILLFQIYYYRRQHGIPTPTLLVTNADGERSPLLVHVNQRDVQEKTNSAKRVLVRYTAATLFICAAGITAWWMSKGTEKGDQGPKHRTKELERTVQLIGWTSVLLYRALMIFLTLVCLTSSILVGARFPQICESKRCIPCAF